MGKVRRIYVSSVHVNIVAALQSATQKSRIDSSVFEQEMYKETNQCLSVNYQIES